MPPPQYYANPQNMSLKITTYKSMYSNKAKIGSFGANSPTPNPKTVPTTLVYDYMGFLLLYINNIRKIWLLKRIEYLTRLYQSSISYP